MNGHYENGYPKKSNDQLSGKFTDIWGGESFACALRDDNKVLCFRPVGMSKVNASDLGSLGEFTRVAGGEGWLCAIDIASKIKCYELDLSNSAKDSRVVKYKNKVLDFAPGVTVKGEMFLCSILEDKKLYCGLIEGGRYIPSLKLENFKAFGIRYMCAQYAQNETELRCFDQNSFWSADLKQDSEDRFEQFVSFNVTCGSLINTGDLKCFVPETELKKSNKDLENEEYLKISVGFPYICALKPDKEISCWSGKDYGIGVPESIKAHD
jgi:hypothetical protein